MLDPFDNDGELVPANSPNEVTGADRGSEPFAIFLEKRVTRRVAERIVDMLEMVEIEQQ